MAELIVRNFELPGRSLAAGKRGMAATSHPTATFAAIEALRDGGNAVDAAVGACAVQCVVEAGSTGIGGDCFALLARGGYAVSPRDRPTKGVRPPACRASKRLSTERARKTAKARVGP